MKIIRGDYKLFKFQRKNKNNEIITDIPKQVYFTIKDSVYSNKVLLQKKLDDGITYTKNDNYYHIEILPEDTNSLKYGDYKYDIEVLNKGNKPKTILVGNIKIDYEVTFAEDEV